MRIWQKTHRLAVMLALYVGIVSIFPQLYLSFFDPNDKGIQMFGADAEYDYVAKINKAYYADYSKGLFPPDPGKNYYLAPQLGERFMAMVGSMFQVSAVTINTAFKFFAPAILFLIIYFWLLEAHGSKKISLIAPLFVILGINLLDPGEISRILSLRTNIDSFLPYTRPISPQISSIFMFLGLWGIYRLFSIGKDSNYKKSILLGILVGVSLYSYIYTWTFLVVLLALYFMYFIYHRNVNKLKHIFAAIVSNLVIALPFFINTLKAHKDTDYIDTSARIGLTNSHTPIFGVWLILGYLMIVFLWPSAYKNIKLFFLFIFTALAIVLNQQIITGIKLQPGHYHWYITQPLIAIVITFLMVSWSDRTWPNRKIVPWVLGLVFMFNAVLIQANSYSENYGTYLKNQQYAPLFSFLDQTYPQEMGIWAGRDLSTLILAHTRHHAPNNVHAQYYIDSRDHLRDILFLEYRLGGTTDKDIVNTLAMNKEHVTSRLFGIYYRDLPGHPGISDEELAKLAVDYREFYKIPLDRVLKNLKIDMIIVNVQDKNIDLHNLAVSSKIEVGEDFYVYKLKTQ